MVVCCIHSWVFIYTFSLVHESSTALWFLCPFKEVIVFDFLHYYLNRLKRKWGPKIRIKLWADKCFQLAGVVNKFFLNDKYLFKNSFYGSLLSFVFQLFGHLSCGHCSYLQQNITFIILSSSMSLLLVPRQVNANVQSQGLISKYLEVLSFGGPLLA